MIRLCLDSIDMIGLPRESCLGAKDEKCSAQLLPCATDPTQQSVHLESFTMDDCICASGKAVILSDCHWSLWRQFLFLPQHVADIDGI